MRLNYACRHPWVWLQSTGGKQLNVDGNIILWHDYGERSSVRLGGDVAACAGAGPTPAPLIAPICGASRTHTRATHAHTGHAVTNAAFAKCMYVTSVCK